MEKKVELLSDKASVRWLVIALVSLLMFGVYAASDVLSPLKTMLEQNLSWTSSDFGLFSGSYSLFNVALFMLILGGLMLDKMGIRFSGLTSGIIMVIGISFKYWAMTNDALIGQTIFGMKAQVVYMVIGFATFGVGAEVAGITVSKAIAKWFGGKELALAMGMQLAVARLGSALALSVSPIIAAHFKSVSTPVLFVLALLVIGLLSFLVYNMYDKKLDKQISDAATEKEESFKLSDVKVILNNKGFWLIAILCLVFYSAVFPFLKFASDLMVNKFSVEPKLAGLIPSLLPFGCILLTPLFGTIYDRKGHGADLMILGSVMLACVHIIFALPITTYWVVAIILMIVLGIAFALVPSAMWPSLVKIIPNKQLGTAYSLIFYIQNIGLLLMPIAIGNILDTYCKNDTGVGPMYNYTIPIIIFAVISSLAIGVALLLKREDKIKGYGLQQRNKIS